MNKIFNVATRSQAAIFSCELKGQISDGRWENSYPLDHWKLPCEAAVFVDPSNVGRNFKVRRTYRFAESWLVDPKSSDFVDACNARAIAYAKAAIAFPNLTIRQIQKFSYCIEGDFWWSKDHPYYKTIVDEFKEITGISSYEEMKSKLDAVNYTNKDLHKDLTALSKAYRTLI